MVVIQNNMEASAKLRFLRMSPRKVRLVCDIIRGMDAEEAQNQLRFLRKKAAKPVLKLLESAMANAENNFKLKRDNLFIKKITADEGPSLKRWRPRAFGRVSEIKKRSSHITIILGEYKVTPKKKLAKAKKSEPAAKKEVRPIVELEKIKKEAKGREEAKRAPAEQKKKSFLSFKNIKEKFTRRLGER